VCPSVRVRNVVSWDMGPVIVGTHHLVTVETKCRALQRRRNVTYVPGHERASRFTLRYRVYSVSINNILMWIYEVYCTI
jgi:hypothetical protein